MADVVGWVAGPTERGTLSLVWSCLITIFACTWTVLHLNVPGYYDKPRTIVLRKLKWMVINILFPEFILSKAICDLRLALHELLRFDAYLQEHEKDTTWTIEDKSEFEVYGMKWSWKVETLSGWSSVLFDLFRLPRTLILRQDDDEHQPNTASSYTRALGSMGISIPLTGPTTKDFAARTEGEPLPFVKAHSQSEQSSCQGGPESNACDLNATTPGQIRSGNDETDLGRRPNTEGKPRRPVFHFLPRPIWGSQEQKWTITHSYYAQMGGLVTYTLSRMGRGITPRMEILTTPKLTRWETIWTGEHPLKHLILRKEDIEDKSKADWFLKTIAILQVTWLVLNVIVRHATRLPITQLEVATVAFAIMAVFTYLANWWKPKDVSRPTVLQFAGERRLKIEKFAESDTQSFMRRLRAPAQSGGDAIIEEDYAQRIGNDVVWLEGETPVLYFLMAGSSLVFGGLHCLAWDFEFSTRIELICWRAASLTSAVLPLVTLAINAFLGYLVTSYLDKHFESRWLAEMNHNFGDQQDSIRCTFFVKAQILYTDGVQASGSLCNVCVRPAESRKWDRLSLSEGPYVFMKFSQKRPDDYTVWTKGDDSWYVDGFKSCMARAATSYRGASVSGQCENFSGSKLDGPKLPDARVRTATCGEGTTEWDEAIRVTRNAATWALLFEKRFRRSSNVVFILSFIIYASSRLIILIILFTSLRAAPSGVYENTAWTRFLPSFS